MSLNTKQFRFSRAYPLLMLYAQYIGYELTLGDCFRDDRCKYGEDKSTHRYRLAGDLNVFENGIYLRDYEAKVAHSKLHDFWDMLGGSKRISTDLNHYSFKHNGIK